MLPSLGIEHMFRLVRAGGHVAKQGNYFMRWLSFAVLAVFLSGCVLPPAVTVVSLFADIVSYAETGKTITDHGISLVLKKDCALLRGFKGDICIEPDPGAEFATTLAFTTDPVMAPHKNGEAPDRWLAELSYLSDSLGPAG
jgi:hypothetical protein